MTWPPGQQIPGAGTSAQPALAGWNDKLHAAWKGVEGDPHMWWAAFDGQRWSGQDSVPGDGGGDGPGLAALGDRLYMAYGPGVSDPMRWTSYDGKSWTEPAYVRNPNPNDPSPCSTYNPALVAWPNALRMIWADGSATANNNMYWSQLSGGAWVQPNQLGGNRTSFGPVAAVLDGRVYLVWRGLDYTDESLYWASAGQDFSPGDAKPVPGVGSSHAPALATFGNLLYMAWKGARAGLDDDQHLYWTTFDGTTWSPQQQVPVSETSVGPALAVYQDQLYMAWKGASGWSNDESIWYCHWE